MTRRAVSIALFAAAFVVAAALSLTQRAATLELFLGYGLYGIMAVTAWGAWCFRREMRLRGAGFAAIARRERGFILLGLALAAAVFYALPPQVRVVSDETNLLGMGRNLVAEHRLTIPTQGILQDGRFVPWGYTNPDRPLLFPFLLFLANSVLGYAPANAFGLNFLLLAALLAVAGAAAARRHGRAAGVAMALLLVAQPTIPTYATCAGYDVLNLLALAVAAVYVAAYARAPHPSDLACAFLAVLAAAHTRHESAVFLPAAFAGLVATRTLRWRDVRERAGLYAVGVGSLLLRVWHLWLFREALSVQHQRGDASRANVSLANLGKNAGEFVRAALDPGFFYPFVPALAVASVAALAYLAARDARGRKALLTLALALGAQLAVIWAYWGGGVLDPLAGRYFLVVAAAESAVVLAAAARLARGRDGWLLAGAAAAALLYFPVAVRHPYASSDAAIRKVTFLHQYFAAEKLDRDGLLLVTDFPGRYSYADYGAVGYEYYRSNRADILARLERHQVRQVLFVEDVSVSSRRPLSANQIPTADLAATEVVVERWLAADLMVRVSRLRPPGGAGVPPPAPLLPGAGAGPAEGGVVGPPDLPEIGAAGAPAVSAGEAAAALLPPAEGVAPPAPPAESVAPPAPPAASAAPPAPPAASAAPPAPPAASVAPPAPPAASAAPPAPPAASVAPPAPPAALPTPAAPPTQAPSP